MKRVLHTSLQTYQILEWHEVRADYVVKPFQDSFSALNFLQRFMDDHLNMKVLRDILSESLVHINFFSLSDNEVIAQVAKHLVSGNLLITEFRESAIAISSSRQASMISPAQEPRVSQIVSDHSAAHWFEIKLIDEDGDPISGQFYRIEMPDGSIKEGTLSVDGYARIEGISNPGTCKVSFPKLDGEDWHRE